MKLTLEGRKLLAESLEKGTVVEYGYTDPDGEEVTGTGIICKSNRGGIRVLRPNVRQKLLVINVSGTVYTKSGVGATKYKTIKGKQGWAKPTGETAHVEYKDNDGGWVTEWRPNRDLSRARPGDAIDVTENGRKTTWTVTAVTKNERGVIFAKCRTGSRKATWIQSEAGDELRMKVPASVTRRPKVAPEDFEIVPDGGDDKFDDETLEVLTRANTLAMPVEERPEYMEAIDARHKLKAYGAAALMDGGN